MSITQPLLQFMTSNRRWLGAGGLLSFGSCFGQTFFISIFAAEIMAHYGLSDGQWGQLYAIGTFTSGLLIIWAGSAVDWFRVRYLAPILLIFLALFCLAMSINNAVWLLPIIIFGLRFCGQGMLSHISAVAMAKWFVANRGKAVSIGGLGFSIGEALLPMIVVALLVLFGWKNIWVISAGVCLLAIPLIFWMLKTERQPRSVADDAEHTGMQNKHWTRVAAMRHPLFWLLLPLSISPSVLTTAVFFQQVHMAQVKGWSHGAFVSLFPLYSLTTVIFMLIAGIIVDRIGARRLMPIVQIPTALGFVLLWQSDTLWAAAIGMVFLGISQGAWTTVPIAFWADAYGSKYLGGIKAILTAAMVVGSAIGPIITGYLIDLGITFPEQMPVIVLYVLAVCGLSQYAIAHYCPIPRLRRK